MFKNYIKTAIRLLRRDKLYSFINITGLAIGLAACILILLYIQYELSYDRYNQKADRIFRVTEHRTTKDQLNYATSAEPLAPILQSNFPSIEQTARIVPMSHHVSTYDNVLVSHQSKHFYEQRLYFADPAIFQIFTIPVFEGNPEKGLSLPNTIFISESIARKYFGKQDPLGQTIKIGQGQEDYEITGIFKDFPYNSHIHADFLASYATIENTGRKSTDWFPSLYTYLLLKNKSDASKIEKRLSAFVKEYVPSSKGITISFSLMPLLDIHLHSDLRYEAEQQGDIRFVYLFAAVAALILTTACFNYVNMATARSTKRALETGIRKTVGASRKQLTIQYFSESLFLNLIALLLAMMVAYLLLPYFNRVTGLHISLHTINSLRLVALLTGLLFSMSILSGIYPALLLSSFKPAHVLKEKIISSSGIGLRKGLITLQFTISMTLIICAIVLQKQMNYIQNQRPGTEDSRLILIKNRRGLTNSYHSFKSELLLNPRIRDVTTTQFVPGIAKAVSSFDANDIEGYHEKTGRIPVFYGDVDFINTLGFKIIKGRNFSKQYSSDKLKSVLVNKAAVKKFGWTHPVGKYMKFKEVKMIDGKMTFYKQKKQVIGVVKNFHYESLKKEVGPVIIQLFDGPSINIIIQASNDKLPATISFIKEKWNEFVPGKPLDYSFLKDDYAAMYHSDYLLEHLFKNFAMLAIVIACMGLFGLSTFSVEQRTKEIGIRKILGASVTQIITLLSKDFLLLVGIAFVAAVPIAWILMNKWLQNFAYRINISWWIFAVAGVLAIMIALITVSFQAIKAARANPVKSLRAE